MNPFNNMGQNHSHLEVFTVLTPPLIHESPVDPAVHQRPLVIMIPPVHLDICMADCSCVGLFVEDGVDDGGPGEVRPDSNPDGNSTAPVSSNPTVTYSGLDGARARDGGDLLRGPDCDREGSGELYGQPPCYLEDTVTIGAGGH